VVLSSKRLAYSCGGGADDVWVDKKWSGSGSVGARISLGCRCRIGGMRLALTLGKDAVGIQGGARRGACDDKLR
jgi:hypothetical protein